MKRTSATTWELTNEEILNLFCLLGEASRMAEQEKERWTLPGLTHRGGANFDAIRNEIMEISAKPYDAPSEFGPEDELTRIITDRVKLTNGEANNKSLGKKWFAAELHETIGVYMALRNIATSGKDYRLDVDFTNNKSVFGYYDNKGKFIKIAG